MIHRRTPPTDYDIGADAGGRDPDRFSPTLRRQHVLLWSKPLPDGREFLLTDEYPSGYLRHVSDLGTFDLSSDTIYRSFRHTRRASSIIAAVPTALLDEFNRRGRTVAGTIVFPSRRIDRTHTINQARGMSRAIEDRFDLTLECIRRHYSGGFSPLAATLERYQDFFSLFGTFDGYVQHFLLQDLVDERTQEVRFFNSWTGFDDPPIPATAAEYLAYAAASMDFLDARRARMDTWIAEHVR